MPQFLNIVGRVRSSYSKRIDNMIDARVVLVRTLEEEYSGLSDQALQGHLNEQRLEARNLGLGNKELRDAMMDKSAAIGACAIQRIMGFRLHDIQIKGAIATAAGSIIQMNTGEGKTMVCGLTALIRSVFDTSVHVATTNAYLAERDHETIQPVYRMLGTTSSYIGPDSSPAQIHAGYRCNITYAPGYMFGFDYLRDQLLLRDYESLTLGRNVLEQINGGDFSAGLAQTSHSTIIVDEADSVLIDESTTPLLLSGPGEDASESALQAYRNAMTTSAKLKEKNDYDLNVLKKTIELTDDGLNKVHEALLEFGRMDLTLPWPTYITNALFAEHFLVRDENYVVADDKIKLVDQNTGRIFDDRSLRAGLHQAVEAKDGVSINPPNQTLARVTRQRFFKLYDMVCGMTGTAIGSEQELKHFYDVVVVPLTPNIPCKRIELPDRFFADWNSKLVAIVEDVESRQKSGQPILIGTRTIRESILINSALNQRDLRSKVLNGIQDQDEAELIADAGNGGEITIATNMAGRGTDIKLTDDAKLAGGLHVIGTQRFESRRVDNQLAGRAARQGDPGSSQFFVAADDQMIRDHSTALASKIFGNADQDGECNCDFSEQVKQLQDKIEADGFQRRCQLVKQEGWMDCVRETMVGS